MNKYRQLSREERYTIARLLTHHRSKAEIARILGRSKSTITRELANNRSNSDNVYRVDTAQSYATARRRRARRVSHFSPDQWKQIESLLKLKWSPEQIVGFFNRFGSFSISHETIYRRIRVDRRRGGSLYSHTRIMPKRRRKRYGTKDSRGVLPGKRHISQRPLEVESRQTLGHWEGDTVVGSDRHHCILTLVERKSGFAIIKKMPSRTVVEVVKAARAAISQHRRMFKTLTLDNGTEFHGYEQIEQAYPLTCYFATPYHSWERGSNENLNGLIRQYIPKGTSMKNLTQRDCDRIARHLNSRPRKRLDFRTPFDVYLGKDPLLRLKVESTWQSIEQVISGSSLKSLF